MSYSGSELTGAWLEWSSGKTCHIGSGDCCGGKRTLVIPAGSQITGIRGHKTGDGYASRIQFLIDDGVNPPYWDETFGVSGGTE